MKLTKQGDINLAVVRLQLQLRFLNFYNYKITGEFNYLFKIAVFTFQEERGLIMDGIVGPQTRSVLDKETKDAYLLLFLHNTGSREGQHFTAQEIVRMQIEDRGFARPGYSDIDQLDGELVNVRDWNQDDLISHWEYSWGVAGATLLNRNARHYCYVGGMNKEYTKPKDTRTPTQKAHMETYIKFNLLRNPKLVIAGHNQVQPRGCPSFDVPSYLDEIGIPKYNQALWGKMYS